MFSEFLFRDNLFFFFFNFKIFCSYFIYFSITSSISIDLLTVSVFFARLIYFNCSSHPLPNPSDNSRPGWLSVSFWYWLSQFLVLSAVLQRYCWISLVEIFWFCWLSDLEISILLGFLLCNEYLCLQFNLFCIFLWTLYSPPILIIYFLLFSCKFIKINQPASKFKLLPPFFFWFNLGF